MSDEKFGASFDELSQSEMDFITGATGSVQSRATPTIVTATTASSYMCISASISALSGLVSYTKQCI